MSDFDLDLVHPSVTDDEIQKALHGTPAPFPDVAQDEADEERGFTVVPATPSQAMATLKDWTDNHTNVGVGTCLMTQRRAWRLPAMWPTANDGFDNAAPLHKFSSLSKVPRGMVFWYENDSQGHVVTSLGGGLCRTTDFHESGFVGVALLSRVGEWCRAIRMAGGETLNGFDVWPDPSKPKPVPKPFTLEERLNIIQNRIRTLKAAGHDKRVKRFELWRDQLKAMIEAQK